MAAPVVRRTLFEYYDEFTREHGKLNDWIPATVQKFAALRAHLVEFDSGLTFEVLSETKLTELVSYLKDTCYMRNLTMGKQLGCALPVISNQRMYELLQPLQNAVRSSAMPY